MRKSYLILRGLETLNFRFSVSVIYQTGLQSWTLLRVRLYLRHASFPLAFHLAVSSHAVRVGYAEGVLRVGLEPTFYCLLKRTHTLVFESGLNFRWQYTLIPLFYHILMFTQYDFLSYTCIKRGHIPMTLAVFQEFRHVGLGTSQQFFRM